MSTQIPSPLDAKVYRELSAVLGADKVDRLLQRLEEGLARSFVQFETAALDRAELGREAHSLVSQAGMLGFLELADLCRDLETACSRGDDPAPLLARTRQARDRALQEIARLRSAREPSGT
jgi:HPt (histidine-containing phosphotransfer) domain-containing protein